MNFVKILCLAVVGIMTISGGYARKPAEIFVKINLEDAAKVYFEPNINFDLYDLAVASLDEDGRAVLKVDTKTPILGVLKITTDMDKPLGSVSLYLSPATEVKVAVEKKEGDANPAYIFSGDLKDENSFLYSERGDIFFLNMGQKVMGIVKQLEEKLSLSSCSSEFKDYLSAVWKTLALEKQLPEMSNNPAEYTEALNHLLGLLKTEDYWQSMGQWPKVFDDIFARCESCQLVEKSEAGLSSRLDCIGDENLRNRYGIYTLQCLVNLRDWFENPPIDILKKMRPYFTTQEGKEKYEAILKRYEYFEKSWAHLRNFSAPDFNFEDVNGKMVRLSDYRGKFVLLDVWNIYCGPCMAQVPYLKKFEPELEKMGVVVIGVSADPQNIKDKWQAKVKEKGMAGIQTIMDNGRKSQFMKDYVIYGFPTFCLINPDGQVINPYVIRPELPNFMGYIQEKINEYNKKKASL